MKTFFVRLIHCLLICTLGSGLALPLTRALAAEDAAARIATLRAEIARHDELYFRHAAPVITDVEYDALRRELRDLLAAQGASAEEALGFGDDRVETSPRGFHRVPMRGLEKSYSEPELRRFLQRAIRRVGPEVRWVVEPKYDGLAISLSYEHGRLSRAVTRGNGNEGDDVTTELLACASVPAELEAPAGQPPAPEHVEIRGEVYLPWAEFRRINAERRAAGEMESLHPRNLAVGTLKARDPGLRADRRLAFVAYGWGAWVPMEAAPRSQQESLLRLREWGFAVPPSQTADDVESVVAAVREVGRQRDGFPAPLDGAVVKVDSIAWREKLGETEGAPRWAIAHKFEPERVEARLRAITLQVGRTGLITPVAEMEPVEVGGAIVARASLHNAREIARRDYRVGDWVRVERAGEVVPQLVGVNLARRPAGALPYSFPTACPACDTALAREGDAQVRCPNRDCPPQVQRRLEHAASPAALDLTGFGPTIIAELVARGRLRRVEDFFQLGDADVRPALRASIERSRRSETWRFVAAVGLPEVGATGAKRLGERFRDLAALADADLAALRAAGLTTAAAQAARESLSREDVQHTLRALDAVRLEPLVDASRAKLAGRRFVFTGTLRSLTRDAAIAKVRELGGDVQSTVTRQTDFVVVGEGGGQKIDDARRLGRRVVSEEEFLALLADP